MGQHMRTRRELVAGTAALVALSTGLSRAGLAQVAPWPTRPVRIVVPVAAGTATDLTARIFGNKLALTWGQGVVVENKPGADGLIALGSFVSGRDDHTLLFSFSTAVSLNPLIHAKLPYDPAVDLVPITTTSEVLFAIAVNAGIPAATLADLNAYARAHAGTLNWASAPGLPRFVFERHRREHALDLAYVGYNQTGAAVQDLGEGRIQVMIAALNTLLPVIENGKARLLVMASTDRAPTAANVPHAIEAGFPKLVIPAIGCAYGWKDMSVALRDRVAADIDAVARDVTVSAQLAKVGQLVRRSSPVALATLLAEQRTALAPLAAIMAQTK
jgi:tripartite-type tricarboxylate transporter receptor subunit TctC